jgi:hypothetical protein
VQKVKRIKGNETSRDGYNREPAGMQQSRRCRRGWRWQLEAATGRAAGGVGDGRFQAAAAARLAGSALSL